MQKTMRNGISQRPQPDFSRLFRRARSAHERGDCAKAERLYTALLDYHPDNFDVLHGLGQLHYQSGRFDTALVLIQSALKIDDRRADGFASLGLVFYFLRQLKEALASYDAGLRLEPDNTDLLNRRGVALLELHRPRDALESFERLLAANPDHLDALGNCGNALIKLNRPTQALAVYDKALTLAPENAQLLTNRAVALRRLDRPHEAVMSASRAIVHRPDFAHARFVESVARLTLGDFNAGWPGYEARWSVGALATQRRSFTAPLWLGKESLDGKTILLHAEQGFGDTIQFVRYAPLLAARGAAVVLEVQANLVRLLSRVAGVTATVARGEPLTRFDFHCPLLSLPLAFATELTTIPANIPYFAIADDEVALWRQRLPARRQLIGLTWSGEPSHDNDLNRSLCLETLAPLLDLPDVHFVSLQHEVREEDAAVLQNLANVFQIEPKFKSFADTAAVLAALDAVISVDTAVAHLAGAMGKPLFLLLPFAADFRWLRERQDSPWYPTARLFRQPKFGDWDGAVVALRQDLMRFGISPQKAGASLPTAHKLSA
jgi:tetratricopeptide (TPR) repeat protein